MIELDVVVGRLIPYWITVCISLFIISFWFAWTEDPAYNLIYKAIFKPLTRGMHDHEVDEWSAVLIGMIAPVFLASCACSLLLTTQTLPTWRCIWLQKTAAVFRRHPSTREDNMNSVMHASVTHQLKSNFWFFVSSLRLPFRSMASDALYGYELASKKVNQFGRGEPDFNVVSFFAVVLPIAVGLLAYLPTTVQYADETAAEEGISAVKYRTEGISYLFGYGSILCLSLFLIPVTKHSVLLVAMGWSPIHALRIHIWSGYLSFVFMLIHGIMLVTMWLIFEPYPVYKQIIPDSRCWTRTRSLESEMEIQPSCRHVHANLSGVVAAVFFVALWGSSLNWVRRRNYRLFYIFHMTFGTLTLLGTILHMYWFVLYFIPSFTYYLALTAPTLVQAVASRFRGGVKIRKVVLVEDSGGCVEVQIGAHPTVHAVLDREPCQFIKVCVPKISLIWHPFDVFKSYNVDGTPDETVRFLFRPVGPFTKELAKRLTSDIERPVTLVDGFYLGADKSELALQHDCVTMVAGGVALSPYLTLIPALLNRITKAEKRGDKIKTKSIVLHWVVREPGLCRHYAKHYLNAIVKRARMLNLDCSLTIYVYLTGGTKFVPDSIEMVATAELRRLPIEALVGDESTDLLLDETAGAVSGSFVQDTRSNDGRSCSLEDREESSSGHLLELTRMLSRRYSNVLWNIPFFVFYAATTFFGFRYLWKQIPIDPSNYYELSKMTWIILYAILVYFGFGIFSETCVLCLRKYWPQPAPDTFEVVAARGAMKELTDSDDLDFSIRDENLPSANVTLIYRQGRPSSDQIFDDARAAAEPGIFTCGPSALTHMVRAEASKENSYLGLTRYCLYDEPYEM